MIHMIEKLANLVMQDTEFGYIWLMQRRNLEREGALFLWLMAQKLKN